MITPYLFAPLLAVAATALAAEVPAIQCPADPPQVRRLQLEEKWRIDGEDPETPLLGYFAQSQVMIHEDRVYMLDRQLCQILIYSMDGEYLDTILREGEGPGEIRRPGRLFLRSDGRIAVQHGYPTKMEFVELDGTPHGQWSLQANAWVSRIQETTGGWYGTYTESRVGNKPGVLTSTFRAAILDDNGERQAEFYSKETVHRYEKDKSSDEAEEHNPWMTALAVGDGQVVLAAARDEYRLEWRNLAGETTRIVTRDFAAHERTRVELDQLKYSNYSIVSDELLFPERKLCKNDPVILGLDPLSDGAIRIRTSIFEKDMPPGMVCRYEVHEGTGELRESVEIYDPTGAYDVRYDIIALLDRDHAMILRNLRTTSRTAIAPRLHPKLREHSSPIPDDREDMAFTPILCRILPYSIPTKSK